MKSLIKRLSLIVVGLSVVFSISACNKNEVESDTATTTQKETRGETTTYIETTTEEKTTLKEETTEKETTTQKQEKTTKRQTTVSKKSDKEQAQEAVEKMLTALKKHNFKEAEKYMDVDAPLEPESELEDMFLEKTLKKLEFKVLSSEKIDSKTIHVKTRVTSIDMQPVFIDFMAESLKLFTKYVNEADIPDDVFEKEAADAFFKCMDKNDEKRITNEADIIVVKKDGKWVVRPDMNLTNLLFGNFECETGDYIDAFDEILFKFYT